MKLIVQPEDGIEPILKALGKAKKSIQIVIFRIDGSEVERALTAAVERGVSVQALVACSNRGGEKLLRRFETRMLEKGVTVTRTADDLLRYHGKMVILDRKELYLLAFNFCRVDIALSRSFGVITREPKVVEEAIKLFECDVKRISYKAGNSELLVSPVNAREQLAKFIAGAKQRLLIYDMKISDRAFLQLLTEKVSQGVDVRVIGRSSRASLSTRALPMRLHARVILRDESSAFLGSQSMRKLELELRREIGIIFHDSKVVNRMTRIFDSDWSTAIPVALPETALDLLELPAKKVAKVVAKRLDVEAKMGEVLEKVADKDRPMEPEQVVESVREAVRNEVHEAVVTAIRELVTEVANSTKPETPAEERDPET